MSQPRFTHVVCMTCVALYLLCIIRIQSYYSLPVFVDKHSYYPGMFRLPHPMVDVRLLHVRREASIHKTKRSNMRAYMAKVLSESMRNATRSGATSSQKRKAKMSPLSSASKVRSEPSQSSKRMSGGIDRRNNRKVMHSAGRGPSVNRVWRLFNIEVPLHLDPGKDYIGCHTELLAAITKLIGFENKSSLSESSIKVIKKSFDGRWKKSGPKFVYTVDIDLTSCTDKKVRIYPKEGQIEVVLEEQESIQESLSRLGMNNRGNQSSRIVIVGAGPSGLFAAIALAEAGLAPIIIERGQPVELRGRAIGALFNRKILDPESNLCYGEGGAGTWSDGKLTTRIGKNSANVRWVLEALVQHGAPERILVDGKPHLGTDRLVRILKEIRRTLEEKGVRFLFDSRVEDFILNDDASSSMNKRTISGLRLSNGSVVDADAVVLSVGHSARKLYHRLLHHGVHLEPKPIAAGFRIEHPQELINRIQYGEFGKLCGNGDGVVPVADYRVVSEVFTPTTTDIKGGVKTCYSFCMCPGGQIVPTSVNPDELCINGMSFSKRQSKWANSALVVNIDPSDMVLTEETRQHEAIDTMPLSIDEMRESPLKGVYWQEEMERRAAVMGGGSFVVPVQRVTDFLVNSRKDFNIDSGYFNSTLSGWAAPQLNGTAIQSSYRLGVKEAPLHELYPPFITNALHSAILDFDRKMPGFISPDAILHGVETRTSAPVQITRDPITCQSISLGGLYPAGEGAGYAGGIVSAAVDGLRVAQAILRELQCKQ